MRFSEPGSTIYGPANVTRYIFKATGDSCINLCLRAFEITHSELRRAFGLPEPNRDSRGDYFCLS